MCLGAVRRSRWRFKEKHHEQSCDYLAGGGGSASVGMRFDSGELMQNTNEIVAYGTAVILKEASR